MNENQTTENFYSYKEISEIDLGKIFRFLLMQSKLIISIVFLVFAILTKKSYFEIIGIDQVIF